MKTWKDYYRGCKEIYQQNLGIETSSVEVYDLLCEVNSSASNVFAFDDKYFKTVSQIKDKLDHYYQDSKFTFREGLAIGLRDVFLLETELSFIIENYFRKYLETQVFGCYIHCDNIKIYKTPKQSTPPKSSWVWHFDNNPREQIKVMIYFNDVKKDSGSFRYLEKDNGGVKITSSQQDYKYWYNGKRHKFEALGIHWTGQRNLENVVSNLIKAKNCKIVDVVGKAGTAILFDNNILHKGTIPSQGFRYAATLQLKPIHLCPEKIFNKKITGNGWRHTTFNMDPAIYEVVKR